MEARVVLTGSQEVVLLLDPRTTLRSTGVMCQHTHHNVPRGQMEGGQVTERRGLLKSSAGDQVREDEALNQATAVDLENKLRELWTCAILTVDRLGQVTDGMWEERVRAIGRMETLGSDLGMGGGKAKACSFGNHWVCGSQETFRWKCEKGSRNTISKAPESVPSGRVLS